MTADHHHPAKLAPIEARVAAIESVLVEKGILDTDALDQIVQHFEDNLGPMNGAKVVARAWSDPAYKERLLADGTAAIADLGFKVPRASSWSSSRTPQRSTTSWCARCAPATRGRRWGCRRSGTKAPAYRSRAVREPRKLLAEMGTVIPADVEIRVWDSSAEARYLVLPMRPDGTEDMSEEQLAGIVTRDSMIGVQRL